MAIFPDVWRAILPAAYAADSMVVSTCCKSRLLVAFPVKSSSVVYMCSGESLVSLSCAIDVKLLLLNRRLNSPGNVQNALALASIIAMVRVVFITCVMMCHVKIW